MNLTKIVAIVVIAAGVLALVYGGFTYTKETHQTKLGALELSVEEKDRFEVPVWAGVGAIAVGTVLLLWGGRKR